MQYFCGEENFQHTFPLEPSAMTHFRNRVGDQLLETLNASARPKRVQYKFGCKVSIATNLHAAKGGHFIYYRLTLSQILVGKTVESQIF
jgi:hypothetical protein